MPAPRRPTPAANDPVEEDKSASAGISEAVEPESNPLHRSPATEPTRFGSPPAVSGAAEGAAASTGAADSGAEVAAVGEPAGTDRVPGRVGPLFAVDGFAAERAAAGEAELVAVSAPDRLWLASEEAAVEEVCRGSPVRLVSGLLVGPALSAAALVDWEVSPEVSPWVPWEASKAPEPVEPPPVPLADEPTTSKGARPTMVPWVATML